MLGYAPYHGLKLGQEYLPSYVYEVFEPICKTSLDIFKWYQFSMHPTKLIGSEFIGHAGIHIAAQFTDNLNTGVLVELNDFKKPKRNLRWASISPDGQTIVFAKKYNLYWMDKANYEKALVNEEDSTIVENQLTKDGIEYFEYGNSQNETNVDKEKNKNKRKPAFILWSPDSKHL